jgi:hypothetical protein
MAKSMLSVDVLPKNLEIRSIGSRSITRVCSGIWFKRFGTLRQRSTVTVSKNKLLRRIDRRLSLEATEFSAGAPPPRLALRHIFPQTLKKRHL